MVKLNKVKERFIYLSPTVQAGWEDESNVADFDFQKILGKGAFGKVTKAIHKRSKLTYAIKEINKQNLKENNMVDQVSNEIKIMYSLNHPNILKLFNHFEDDISIYLVLEFAPNGQLYQQMWRQPNKRYDEKNAAQFCYQLAQALECCHQKFVIHRDIKPENLLLDINNNIKLADFGWSNFLKPNQKQVRETFCGTLDYLAPEMVENSHKHDYSVDIWSVGVLIYELLTGQSPFAPKEKQLNPEYVESKTKENILTLNYQFPKDFPPLVQDLVKKILIKDQKKRLSLQDIMRDPWMQTQNADKFTHVLETINQNKALQKSDEVDKLKQDGKVIFSEEEIRKYSRPDSIINKDADATSTKKGQDSESQNQNKQSQQQFNELNQNIKTLDNKCKQLEIEKQKIVQENHQLKQLLQGQSKNPNQIANIMEDYQNLQIKLKAREEQFNSLKRENDYQWGKLMESEKKVRELQEEINRIRGQSSTSSPQEIDKIIIDDQKKQLNELKQKLENTEKELIKYKQSGGSYLQDTQKSNEIDDYLEKLKQKQLQELNALKGSDQHKYF